VVPVEKHEGIKATVAKRLAAKKRGEEKVGQRIAEGLAKQAELTKAEAPKAAKKAAAKPAAAPAKKSAGARSIPAEAANKKRQAYVKEVGMDKYRDQYNSGWDAATYGQGAKKAASGTAPVAWMDGWTGRTANPGKAGIASKWTALRSESDSVAKVEPPGKEKAEAPAKGKAKKS
jgi:hypothetical protein